jgi:hypothetical protein
MIPCNQVVVGMGMPLGNQVALLGNIGLLGIPVKRGPSQKTLQQVPAQAVAHAHTSIQCDRNKIIGKGMKWNTDNVPLAIPLIDWQVMEHPFKS